jgi:hypothetical protein
VQRRVRVENESTGVEMKYPIKEEDYLRLYNFQAGSCKICGNSILDKYNGDIWKMFHEEKPNTMGVVDHDHKTGEVRGLLCRKCNSGLGFFDEVPWALMESIRYMLGLGQREYIDWLKNVIEYRLENLEEE